MRRPTAEIARHTVTYGFGFVVGGIARLVLIPVIARTLSADEYGVYSLLLAAVAFLQILFELGFVETLIRFHHEREDPGERLRLRALLFSVMPVVDLVLAAPLLLLRDELSALLFGTPAYGWLVAIAVAIAFFGTQLQLFLGHLRAEDRSRRFVVVMALRGAVALGTTLVLVFWWKLGIVGFLLGQLAAPAVVTLAVLPRMLSRADQPLSAIRGQLAPLLRFGLPLVPSGLGIWGLSYLDAYLLRAFADLESVGVYRFAAEVCMPLSLILTSFHFAWPSFAFARARGAGGAENLARVFRHVFVVLAWASLAIAALRREILEALGADAFSGSAQLIPLWVLATCVYGLAQVFGTGLRVAGDTRSLPVYVLLAIALNAGLAILLIPTTGVLGCAAAKVVTLVALAALVLRESNRQFRIPFELGKLVAIVAAGALLLLVTDSYGKLPLLPGIAARAGTILVFPWLLLPARALSWQELRSLPAVLRDMLSTRGGADTAP